MKAELENELVQRIQAGESARDILRAMVREGKIKNIKQGLATLIKWDSKGFWDYGVTLDLGWFTEDPPIREIKDV